MNECCVPRDLLPLNWYTSPGFNSAPSLNHLKQYTSYRGPFFNPVNLAQTFYLVIIARFSGSDDFSWTKEACSLVSPDAQKKRGPDELYQEPDK